MEVVPTVLHHGKYRFPLADEFVTEIDGIQKLDQVARELFQLNMEGYLMDIRNEYRRSVGLCLLPNEKKLKYLKLTGQLKTKKKVIKH